MHTLSPEQVEAFERDGYVVVEDVFSSDDLRRLNGELDRIVNERTGLDADQGGFNLEKTGESPFAGDAKAAGVFRKIQSLCAISDVYRELAVGDTVLDIVEDLIGPSIYFHSNKLMFKPAQHGSAKPWHQDYAYWRKANPEPTQVSVWIALEDATPENGCMQMIPGSHKLGLLDHHKAELQVALEDIDLDNAVQCPMRAGSLVVFHCLTLHYSPPNQSDRSRRAMILTYGPSPDAGEPVREASETASA